MRIIILIGVLALTLTAQAERRDLVILKSWRTLEGRVLEAGTNELHFEDRELGRIVLPWQQTRCVQRHGEDRGIFGLAPERRAACSPPGEHVRVAPDGTGLETAVSFWHAPGKGIRLLLVGAVHIAEPEYWHTLQRILDQQDLVLYEAVAQGAKPLSAEDLKRLDALGALQRQFADALALGHQRDGLDYKRAHWKHADVTADVLMEELAVRKAGLPTDSALARTIAKMIFQGMKPADPAAAERARKTWRRLFGGMMARSGKLLRSFGAAQEVILDFRNAAAMKVLAEELRPADPARSVALFYGAAHLPDFAERLSALGFSCHGTEWVRAWSF